MSEEARQGWFEDSGGAIWARPLADGRTLGVSLDKHGWTAWVQEPRRVLYTGPKEDPTRSSIDTGIRAFASIFCIKRSDAMELAERLAGLPDLSPGVPAMTCRDKAEVADFLMANAPDGYPIETEIERLRAENERLTRERDEALAHHANFALGISSLAKEAETEHAAALATERGERDALAAAVRIEGKCRQCNGKGRYLPSCSFCDDSTHDHECPDERACGTCDGTGMRPTARAALAGSRAALDARLAEARREALEEAAQACDDEADRFERESGPDTPALRAMRHAARTVRAVRAARDEADRAE